MNVFFCCPPQKSRCDQDTLRTSTLARLDGRHQGKLRKRKSRHLLPLPPPPSKAQVRFDALYHAPNSIRPNAPCRLLMWSFGVSDTTAAPPRPRHILLRLLIRPEEVSKAIRCMEAASSFDELLERLPLAFPRLYEDKEDPQPPPLRCLPRLKRD